MYCPKCGAENADSAKFCLSCGNNLQVSAAPAAPAAPAEPVAVESASAAAPVAAPVAAPAAEASEAAPKENKIAALLATGIAKCKELWTKVKPILDPLLEKAQPYLHNKLIVGGAAGALALIIIICIIVGIATSGNGFIGIDSYLTMSTVDGQIILIRDNKVIETDIEDDMSGGQVSLDYSVLAFLTDAGDLYVVKGNKVVHVTDEVENFVLSSDGKGIAYIVDDGDTNTLHLYNVSSKKSAAISDEVVPYDYDLSPDGKTVCFYEYDEEDDSRTLMYATASKSAKVTSSDVELLGLSNSGKYIYVIGENDDGDSILYSYNTKGEREKLYGISSDTVRFNADHTQILFYNEGKSYISAKGKEAARISSAEIRPLLAPNAVTFYGSNSYTVPVKNLFDHVYYGTDSNGNTSAWYIRKNSEKSCKLASNIRSMKLDAEAEYMYYIDDGELKVLKISHGDNASEKAKVLGEDVSSYEVTPDRSKVYYVSDEALYSCNGKNGSGKKTVCNEEIGGLAINKKGVCFYEIDGDVYATSNGRKGKKIISDITDLVAVPNGLVFATSEESIYVSTGSKSLKKLLDID